MTTPVKRIPTWEVPGIFKKDLDSFKRVAELGYAISNFLGYFLDKTAPIGAQFKMVSGYFSATRLISDLAGWIPDQKGEIKAIKTIGNKTAKGISNICYNVLDLVETYLFLGKLKLIDTASISARMGENKFLNFFAKNNFAYLKSGFGILGAAASITDMSIAAHKVGQNMRKNGVSLDLRSGFKGRGWFKAKEMTSAAKKTISESAKDCREISVSLLRTSMKTTLVVLSIIGWTFHPAIGALSLAYSVTSIGQTILKDYEKGPVANDPKYAKAWSRAKQLPTV